MARDDISHYQQRARFEPYKKEHEAQGHYEFTKEALKHNPVDFIKSVCEAVDCKVYKAKGNVL